MSSYATGWIGLVGSCIDISGEVSFGVGSFCDSSSSVSLLTSKKFHYACYLLKISELH